MTRPSFHIFHIFSQHEKVSQQKRSERAPLARGASVILKLRRQLSGGDGGGSGARVLWLHLFGSWGATRIGAGDVVQLVSFAPMLSDRRARNAAAAAEAAAEAAAARGGATSSAGSSSDAACEEYRLDDSPACCVALILHPDRLISPSRVAQSFSCLRQVSLIFIVIFIPF